MVTKADFETRPISDKLWNWMKKIRRDHFWETYKAQAEGGICATGINLVGNTDLLSGFGTIANPSVASGYTRIARMGTAEDGLRKYVDYAETKGYQPICGAIGVAIGQLELGVSYKNPTTGQTIVPDFVSLAGGCPPILKGSQIAAESLGIPLFFIDHPAVSESESRFGKNRSDYIISQYLDAIEWVEKHSGKKFDDEKFIDGVRNTINNQILWAKICELTKHIPSPITGRQSLSLHAPLTTMARSKEVTKYLEALYDEMQERVHDGISGAPFERKRLAHREMHPMYRPDVLRWPEEYGASFITAAFWVFLGVYLTDGRRVIPPTIEEAGIELKTKEDAFRVLLEGTIPESQIERRPEVRHMNEIRRFKEWHIDGVMYMLNRRCVFITDSMLDEKADAERAGMITGSYECSEGNPNEFDEGRIREDFARFYDVLGLTKLVEITPDRDDGD